MRGTGRREAPPRGRAGQVLARVAVGVVATQVGAGLSAGVTAIGSAVPPPVGLGTTLVDLGIEGEPASIAMLQSSANAATTLAQPGGLRRRRGGVARGARPRRNPDRRRDGTQPTERGHGIGPAAAHGARR